MEAICSFETSILTVATLRQIPKDCILHTGVVADSLMIPVSETSHFKSKTERLIISRIVIVQPRIKEEHGEYFNVARLAYAKRKIISE
jgi:hypothetical protein